MERLKKTSDTDKVLSLGSLHLHYGGYRTDMRNGKSYTSPFQNVCITDNADFNESTLFTWDRVYQENEADDMRRIIQMAAGPELAKIGAQLITKLAELMESCPDDSDITDKIKQFRALISTPF